MKVWVATALSIENEAVMLGLGVTRAFAEAQLEKNLMDRWLDDNEGEDVTAGLFGAWRDENWTVEDAFEYDVATGK